MFTRSIARQISLVGAILVLVGLLAACGSKASLSYETVVPAAISPGSAIPAPSEKVILTLSGNIAVKNVGDTLQFDMPTLEKLGLVKYTVDDPWLNVTNTYTGILMSDLRKFAGASPSAKLIHMVGLDDYAVDLPFEDIEKWPVLLATRTNGSYMGVANNGPTRIIYPYHSYSIDPVTYDDYWIWNLATIEVN